MGQRVTPAPPAVVDGGANDDGIPATTNTGHSDARVLDQLARVIAERRDRSSSEKSYTKSLLDAGMPKIWPKSPKNKANLQLNYRLAPTSA